MATLRLTTEQVKPVESNCKINVCLACPGSGKTTVLVARAERLLHDTREPIFICTFSNDAAASIFNKISLEARVGIHVKTIHAFCFDLVKAHWKDLGEIVGSDEWPNEPKLITREQELALIAELFPGKNTKDVQSNFEYMRSLASPPEQLLRLYKKQVYFNKLRQVDFEDFIFFEGQRISKGLITFDDMIGLAEVLIAVPQVAVELSRKYSHILIDEAQDTSDQQWKVLRPLVMASVTSLVVGDYNQSIYGWRNADGSILMNMAQMREAVTFRLTKSFRTGTNISQLANRICYDKSSQIVSEGHYDEADVMKFTTADEEVLWVLKNIDDTTAIISRTNSYLEKFERALIDSGTTYKGKSFYRAAHVKDVYKFLKGFQGTDVLPVIDKAYLNNNSYSKMEIEDFKLIRNIVAKEGLQKFYTLVETSRDLDDTGVTLTTGHESKGLEWKRVVIVGCHTGHIPHRASNDDREERNLLYVMTSRAQEKLMITCINEPSIYLPKEVRNGAKSPSV